VGADLMSLAKEAGMIAIQRINEARRLLPHVSLLGGAPQPTSADSPNALTGAEPPLGESASSALAPLAAEDMASLAVTEVTRVSSFFLFLVLFFFPSRRSVLSS
jgi:hypothetical protein